MSRTGPSKESARRLQANRATKPIEQAYEAQTIWQGWAREAARLFGEHWRSGDKKHLAAFVRHVVAMRGGLRRGGLRCMP